MLSEELQVVLEPSALRNVLHRRLRDGKPHVQKSGMVGLADVIIRPGIQDLLEVVRPVVSCARKNVIIFPQRLGPEKAAEIQPAHPWQLDVQNNQRIECPGEQIAGGLRRVAPRDLVTARADHALQKEPGRPVILDDKNIQGGAQWVHRPGKFENLRRGGRVHSRSDIPVGYAKKQVPRAGKPLAGAQKKAD